MSSIFDFILDKKRRKSVKKKMYMSQDFEGYSNV